MTKGIINNMIGLIRRYNQLDIIKKDDNKNK